MRQSLNVTFTINSKADMTEWLDFMFFVLYIIKIHLSASQSWTSKKFWMNSCQENSSASVPYV